MRRLPCLALLGAVLLCTGDAVRTAAPAGAAAGPAQRARAPDPERPPGRPARPAIVPRSDWLPRGAGERPPARFAARVVAVFVHHTDSPNDYDCADAPHFVRHLYEDHTALRGWDDIGYNFLVDRCGTIYEGRAGGAHRPVVGAHTQGFNRGSTGIAAIGSFPAGTAVPDAMEDAIAALAAWKLGRSRIDPHAAVRLVSTNDRSRYPTGSTATLPAIAGHDTGFSTSCPGAALTARLPAIRQAAAARLRHRP